MRVPIISYKLETDYSKYKKPDDQDNQSWFVSLTSPRFILAEMPIVDIKAGKIWLSTFVIKFLTYVIFLDFEKQHEDGGLNSLVVEAVSLIYPKFETIYEDTPLINFTYGFRGGGDIDILVVDPDTYNILTTTKDLKRHLNKYIGENYRKKSDTVGIESLDDTEITNYAKRVFKLDSIKPNRHNVIPYNIVYRTFDGHIVKEDVTVNVDDGHHLKPVETLKNLHYNLTNGLKNFSKTSYI